jgi:cell division protease FtsH
MEDRERRITAWHEAGHALLQVLCEHTEPLHKVTIIPRGQALGATMTLPERDVLNRTKRELLDHLVVLTGGRIAERLFTDDISTGARMDIKMASETARKMICAFGMSDVFGFQSFGDNQETLFLGREVARSQSYSEETAKKIDAEVERLVSEAYARAEKLIGANRERLEMLVDHLIEAETMDGRDVEELLKQGRILSDEERAVKKREEEAAHPAAQPAQPPAAEPVKGAAAEPDDKASAPPPLP